MVEPTQSNWSEYARLVLSELDRLNKTEERHGTDITALRQDLSLARQEQDRRFAAIEIRLDRLDDEQNPKSVVSRVRETEDADLGATAIRKYRWAIVVFCLGLLSSILLPIVGLIISARGG